MRLADPGSLVLARSAAQLGVQQRYVATSHGQRFLAAVRVRDPDAPPIGIIADWPAWLERSRSQSR